MYSWNSWGEDFVLNYHVNNVAMQNLINFMALFSYKSSNIILWFWDENDPDIISWDLLVLASQKTISAPNSTFLFPFCITGIFNPKFDDTTYTPSGPFHLVHVSVYISPK